MDHIFISYSRKDEKLVTEFVKSLRKRNLEIWQDISGERLGIPYSVKWFEVIEESIFTASGAIIFQTEAWEQSIPCQKEFQLMRETVLPFLNISVDRLMTEENIVIKEAVDWCREQIDSQENNYCRWMLAGAYKVYKKLPIEAYFPTGKHFISNCCWLAKCKKIFKQKKFQGAWVENLKLFLRKAKRKLIWGGVCRGLAAAFLFAVIIWGSTINEVFTRAGISNDTSASGSVFASELRRIGEYDPILAMQFVEEYHAAIEVYTQDVRMYGDKRYRLNPQGDAYAEYVSGGYYNQNKVLADLISRNYPTAFYDSESDCLVDFSSIEVVRSSDRYMVTLSDVTSQVFIYDSIQGTTCQLVLAAVPEVYCFSENGHELIIAAANEVYVYDMQGKSRPELLTYNFENIRDIIMYENKIYAITENNHIVEWDNPFLDRKINRKNIASGEIIQLDDGQVMAVYVDDRCLVKNIDNREEIYLLPFEGDVDQDNISVSSDGAYVAVSYRPAESDRDWIGLIDLTNGALMQTYDTGCSIVGYTFSEEDDSLIVTCYNKKKIARINLETGKIQESIGDTYANPYSIITYDRKILVCDNSGVLNIYNEDLELAEKGRIIGYPAPQKQLVVSLKYDCLLTAGRGGNANRGNYRTMLSSDEQDIFMPVDREPMISTTSVATTAEGDYVAYGNANGSIYIWDVGGMEQVWNRYGTGMEQVWNRYGTGMEQVWNGHCIPESIIRLAFSDDSASVYVLGSSGTIYEIDIYDVISKCISEDPKSIWEMHMSEAKEIKQHMHDLGLY